MESLALKIILTPILIGTASLAGRRWGPTVGGWLVALPLTSGPIIFFLALAHGSAFAAVTAAGTLAGAISQAGFCVIYARLAAGRGWLSTLAASSLGFAAITALLQRLTLAPLPLFLLALLALALALRLMPHAGNTAAAPAIPPAWDIPGRMALATAAVLILTGSAAALGPQLTGLLAPFPLYGTTLAIFAHRLEGPAQASRVLRGLLMGLFSFAGFFLVLASLLDRLALGAAFGASIGVALTIQLVTLRILTGDKDTDDERPPRPG